MKIFRINCASIWYRFKYICACRLKYRSPFRRKINLPSLSLKLRKSYHHPIFKVKCDHQNLTDVQTLSEFCDQTHGRCWQRLSIHFLQRTCYTVSIISVTSIIQYLQLTICCAIKWYCFLLVINRHLGYYDIVHTSLGDLHQFSFIFFPLWDLKGSF